MHNKVVFGGIGFLLLISPLVINADSISDLQAQVQALMAQIRALQGQQRVSSSTPMGEDDAATTSYPAHCPTLTVTIKKGSRDATTGGSVSELQRFLSGYYNVDPEEIVTGYFGNVTHSLVVRFQQEQELPSYGIVGPLTREAIAKVCAGTMPPPPPSSSCTFNGQTIASGSSITAYQSSSVAYGQACASQPRTCWNGTLSGSYAYSSCTVQTQTGASCTFNGQTVANGSLVTAYQASSVPAGQVCASQARTCSNGMLSGSYAYGSCTIQTTQTTIGDITFQNIEPAAGNATSQSNVPKVYCHANICIAGYAKYLNPELVGTNGTAPRFLISRDGGATFTQFTAANTATNSYLSATPNIVGDANGNAYFVFSSNLPAGSGDGVIMKFGPSNDYQSPLYTRIVPGGNYSKYSAAFDPLRNRIYYMNYSNSVGSALQNNFFVIDAPTGNVLKSIPLTATHGTDYGHGLQYANLSFSGSTVYAAWPSCIYPQGPSGPCRYESIQIMRSDDGGDNWIALNGTALTTPLDSSILGPTTNVWTSPSASAGGAWLANFSAQYGGLVHFMFKDGADQHYVRLFSNGQGRLEFTPQWGGQNIKIGSGDGSFAQDGNTGLYAVSGSLEPGASFYSLGVIGSTNAGGTWTDVARARLPLPEGYNPFAISSARSITSDGYLVGIFTAICSNSVLCGSNNYLMTFRARASNPTQTGTSCTFNGQTIANGSSVIAYQSDTVIAGLSCTSQTRTCSNGTLSGTYAYSSCTAQAGASCTFNGQTILSGSSITAYQSSSIAYGQTCASQARTCSNGTLSGSYAFGSCIVQAGATCTQNGFTLQSGQEGRFYNQTYVPYGQSCSSAIYSQMRLCTNGSLGGDSSFQYANCSNLAQGASCTQNGLTLQDGQQGWFFKQTYVHTGQNCFGSPYGIQRMCTNGELGGDSQYQYANCSVNDELAP